MTTTTTAVSRRASDVVRVLELTLDGLPAEMIGQQTRQTLVPQIQNAHGYPVERDIEAHLTRLRRLGDQSVTFDVDVVVAAPPRRDEPVAAAPANRPAAAKTPTTPTTPTPAARPTAVPTAPRPAPPAARRGSAGSLVEVPVADVHPDPDNPREHVDDIEDLAASIASAGLLQPIVVRRLVGRLTVVAGHRRLAAVKHLRWDTVPVIIRADMRPDDVLAAMLIENGQRTDLDPVEEARALRRLKSQMGECTDAALAARVGRGQLHVGNRLAILALPLEDQELLRAGQMNIGDAVRRGRIASGRVRASNSTGHPHLGVEHDLARQARARCIRLGHKSKGRNSVGGVACGACWESVIRADERDQAHARSAQVGHCVTCGTEQTAASA